KTLGSLDWIKISLDSGTPETHAKIHRSHPKDFDRILSNIAYAVKLKKERNYSCTIGIQLLLLPDNAQEVELLAKKSKELGVDYLVVKPYSQHPFSQNVKYSAVHYNNHNHLKELPRKYNNENFSLIIRQHTMDKHDKGRSYRHCYGIPFMTYIDTEGIVWACKDYIGDQRFNLGSITKRHVSEIFNSPETKKFYRWVSEELDVTQCRSNCRLDEANRLLWELKNPPSHVNFI
ncbi:MAG TPA: SPASM domain-containing protein, partial [Candidatus Avalokitesvara rifleensis]|uniref:SPASM domain-containing protein n=1 Tax=Candidatus Avalokitesvara rifleensis TaxID=3367620 RepID=UPI00402842E8